MVARKRVKVVPQNVGFYISMADYTAHAYRATESVVWYVRTHAGQWFANGTLVTESKLPSDLVQLRPVAEE